MDNYIRLILPFLALSVSQANHLGKTLSISVISGVPGNLKRIEPLFVSVCILILSLLSFITLKDRQVILVCRLLSSYWRNPDLPTLAPSVCLSSFSCVTFWKQHYVWIRFSMFSKYKHRDFLIVCDNSKYPQCIIIYTILRYVSTCHLYPFSKPNLVKVTNGICIENYMDKIMVSYHYMHGPLLFKWNAKSYVHNEWNKNHICHILNNFSAYSVNLLYLCY